MKPLCTQERNPRERTAARGPISWDGGGGDRGSGGSLSTGSFKSQSKLSEATFERRKYFFYCKERHSGGPHTLTGALGDSSPQELEALPSAHS